MCASTKAAAAILLGAALAATTTQAQVLSLSRDFTGEDAGEAYPGIAMDAAGTVVYAVSSSNQYGTNPGLRNQIFAWDPTTGSGAQITNFRAGVDSVSASNDGQWLAFRSSGNLTGFNHDESEEVFVMHPDGSGLAQVTSDASFVGDGVFTAVISGSANRIVITSDTDPLGTNPERKPRVFVVDRDGTNIVQIADAPVPGYPAAISDDGSRIAFLQTVLPITRIMVSPADGSSAPTQVATGSGYVEVIALSGDGSTIVFDNDPDVVKVRWDGTGLVNPFVAGGRYPSITDDGQTVLYRTASDDIRKVGANGAGDTLVAAASSPLEFQHPLISGDGSRVAALAEGGQVAGGSNPDGGDELVAMSAAGTSVRQLTNMAIAPLYLDQITLLANGSRIFFRSTDDPVGGNPTGGYQVFTMLANGTGLAQITHTNLDGVRTYSVSDAGLVVFNSEENLTGQNACGVIQTYKINLSGSGLTQVTNGCAGVPSESVNAQVRMDGAMVVFSGDARVGTNTDANVELMRINADGTGLTPITDENTGIYNFDIGTGAVTYIAYSSPGNRDGLNPNLRLQIARIAISGLSYLRITADPTYDSYGPSISGDGNKIVWSSQADFVGSNPGHNYQIFFYDVPTATKHQLSNAAGDGAYGAKITRDGAWVFWSQPDGIVRMNLATSEIQRVSGILKGAYVGLDGVDSTGAHALLGGHNNLTSNTSGLSLFVADQNAKAKINVGKASPTLISWDADPQSKKYDVIRGDVANLAIAANTVDLGAVTCVEDDSFDNQTLGNEDASEPAPGHAFFYLYRGTTGSPAVTGSWGQGMGSRERVAGGGSCSQ